MFRQSPRRNQRNKGIKVKHVLQMCMLLGACIWLFYQMPRSRNGKSSSRVSMKISDKLQHPRDIKLGRKDLLPKPTEEETEDEKSNDNQAEESGHFEDVNRPEDKWQEQEHTEEIEHRKNSVDGVTMTGDSMGDEGKEEENEIKEREERVEQDVKQYKDDNTENEGGNGEVEGDEGKGEKKNEARDENKSEETAELNEKESKSGETTEENENSENQSDETKEEIESEETQQNSTEDLFKEKEVTQKNHNKRKGEEESKVEDGEGNKEQDKNRVKTLEDDSIKKLSSAEGDIHGENEETNAGKKEENGEREAVYQNIAEVAKDNLDNLNEEDKTNNMKQNEFEDINGNNSELSNGNPIEAQSSEPGNGIGEHESGPDYDSSPRTTGPDGEQHHEMQMTDKRYTNDEKTEISSPPSSTTENVVEFDLAQERNAGSSTARDIEYNSKESAGNESGNPAEHQKSHNDNMKTDEETTPLNDDNVGDVGQGRLENSSRISSSSNEEVNSNERVDTVHDDQVDSSTSLPQEEKETRTDMDTLPESGTEVNNAE